MAAISRHLCAAAMVVWLGLGAAKAEPSAPIDVSRWVSDDAVIFVEALRPADLIDRLMDPRVQKPLLGVPTVKNAIDGEQFRKLKEVAELATGKLGTSWDKALQGLTGGGIVFAVEAVEGKPPHIYLVATPTDPTLLKKATETLIELARKDAEDKGNPDPVKRVEYRGAVGYHIGEQLIYGIVKDRLLIADRPETGKMLVDRIEDGLGSAKILADATDYKARKGTVGPEAMAWALARTEKLRKLDPKRFGYNEKNDAGQIIVFGGWPDAIRKAPWAGVSLTWTAATLSADVTMPVPAKGRDEAYKGFVPPQGSGAPALVKTPGTIASLSLWRDFSSAWESRAELLPPEAVQGLAQLDTFAGQFFGGRDFGTGVLGALTSDWRLVVALQDVKRLKPLPDIKLPAFALIIDVKPGDDDFAQRLKVAFQSFVGLTNLGAAQTKSPPLELGSENFEGVTIATARYMPPAPTSVAEKAKGLAAEPSKKEAVNIRHNFSPSTAQVGNHFIIGSSVAITRDVIGALKAPGKPTDATLAAEADGPTLATLVEINRDRLVMRNMLEKGHDKDQAEAEIGLLAALLRYLGQGKLTIQDGKEMTKLGLQFKLGK